MKSTNQRQIYCVKLRDFNEMQIPWELKEPSKDFPVGSSAGEGASEGRSQCFARHSVGKRGGGPGREPGIGVKAKVRARNGPGPGMGGARARTLKWGQGQDSEVRCLYKKHISQ